ncbi:hypothetical protein MJO28_001542 [Puccinia striiformis f. sp. tritici]|uniref:Uncharacterized protein n=1 Tax=Puccinia striiformis f. sp. tritici TaxID=168172 RepID=A0ACC0EW44_9BASI|nr:hypothetical protein MJO28_001542 [Puccinia striiformis f. sp. tritici]
MSRPNQPARPNIYQRPVLHPNPPPYQRYPTHQYSLRPRTSSFRADGIPALRSMPAHAVLNDILARHTIHQPVPVRSGLFTGPMISANRFVVSPGPANPFLRRNPPCRVLQPIPGSPVGTHALSFGNLSTNLGTGARPSPSHWLRSMRNAAPNPEVPPFRPRVPLTPPGRRVVINVPDDESDTTAGNRPEWIAPLDRRVNAAIPEAVPINNAAAERVVPPAPRPRNLETPPTPVSPRGRGFEPSETAANWVHEQVPTLADRPRRAVSPQRAVTPDLPPARVVPDPVTYHELNPIQIHQLLEDPNTPIPYDRARFRTITPSNKYIFAVIGFINYCRLHPTLNPTVRCDRVTFFRSLVYLRL